MVRFGVVCATLLVATACESGVTVDLGIEVPEDVAGGYDAELRGLLRVSDGGDVAPVCGDPLSLRVYSDGFGCRPDEPEVTVEAWVLPVPLEWDPGFCALEVDPDAAALALDPALFPPDLLPERSADDPHASVETKWSWTPVCGGRLEADLVLAP